jgi:hypothetical protein
MATLETCSLLWLNRVVTAEGRSTRSASPGSGARVWPAVSLRLRADLRSHRRTWLALSLIVGLAAGVVLAATAGAQRTDTAFPRWLATNNAGDVLVSPQGTGTGPGQYDEGLGHLPQVQAITTLTVPDMAFRLPSGRLDPDFYAVDSIDGKYGVSIDRPKILQGAMFDPTRADEVLVDPELASLDHLSAGSRVRFYGVPNDHQGNEDIKLAFALTFRVSGIAVFDNQVVPVSDSDAEPEALFTPAFARTGAGSHIPGADGVIVRLRPGTDITRFDSQATALVKRYPKAGPGQPFIANLADERAQVQQAIKPEAIALALFALLAGLAGLVVIAQLLGRQLVLDATDFPVLRAVGMDRRQLVTLACVRAGAVTFAGACAAVVVMILTSPLLPIGPARLAEPSPGFELNGLAIVVGLLAVVLLPLALVLPIAWRVSRPTWTPGRVPVGRPSWLSAVLSGHGSLSARIGTRMALEPGQGDAAVPVRSALVGSSLAVAAIIASIVFGSSLLGLVSTPKLFGQNWTLNFNLGFGALPTSIAKPIISSATGVAQYSGGNYGVVNVAGRAVPAIGVAALHGSVFPTLLVGRPPATRSEIDLGARSLKDAGKTVGQWVSVRVRGVARRMHIVGEPIFPAFGEGSFTPTSLGTGAAVSASLLNPTATGGCPSGASCYGFFLLRFAPGSDLGSASAQLVAAATAAGCPSGECHATTDQPPADIADYSRVRETPILLAGVLALLAVAVIAHALLVSIRRRRRELATLKVLGFVRRQVQGTVAWQATTLAVVALAVGLPLGVLAGRWIWGLFAGSVGVSAAASVPVLAVLVAIPITIGVANLLAAGPGWVAGRLPPARVLRGE